MILCLKAELNIDALSYKKLIDIFMHIIKWFIFAKRAIITYPIR